MEDSKKTLASRPDRLLLRRVNDKRMVVVGCDWTGGQFVDSEHELESHLGLDRFVVGLVRDGGQFGPIGSSPRCCCCCCCCHVATAKQRRSVARRRESAGVSQSETFSHWDHEGCLKESPVRDSYGRNDI